MGAEKAKPDSDIVTGGSLTHSKTPDFSGWATKAGLKCSDGRVIMPDAFKHQDKARVPLVWQHGHNESTNVLGHVDLENREDGVYCYGFFNDTDQGKNGKQLVEHEDIKSLSIFANQLVEKSKQVLHGVIREVSLVLSGANPGAVIDNITITHSDGELVEIEDEAIIFTGLSLAHGEGEKPEELEVEHAEDTTVQDVYDGMTEEQKNVVHYMVGAALESAKKETPAEHSGDKPDSPNDDEKKKGTRMSRNVFEKQNGKEGDKPEGHELSHDAIKGIFADAQERGSFKAAMKDYALQHGIENIDILFPDARAVESTPDFDSRRMEWVKGVINGTKKSPFTRIKNFWADITHDEARAKGYIKGEFKKEEWFGVSKRTTGPATVYKKQKLDRDDILDITDMDVVAWMKGEMRLMLEEEIARAVLLGDGREVDDPDKVKDPIGANDGVGIRSILNDHDLYAGTIFVNIDDASSNMLEVLDAVVRGMPLYKGSGSPTFFTTLSTLTEMLLVREEMTNRRMYRTVSELASELMVSNIVTVEVMEEEAYEDVVGIIVNLRDYTIGTDRGGDITSFEDFDIDYNQYKYLLETRLSGALTKIRSALVVRKVAGGAALVAPVAPGFVKETGVITPATTTGVTYKRADTNATVTTGAPITLDPGDSLKIYAIPASSSYYFADNVKDEWTHKRPNA